MAAKNHRGGARMPRNRQQPRPGIGAKLVGHVIDFDNDGLRIGRGEPGDVTGKWAADDDAIRDSDKRAKSFAAVDIVRVDSDALLARVQEVMIGAMLKIGLVVQEGAFAAHIVTGGSLDTNDTVP